VHDAEILSKFGFYESRGYSGDVRIPCPDCSPTRAKKGERCLSVKKADDGAVLYQCFHCGFAGAIRPEKPFRQTGNRTNGHSYTPPSIQLPPGGLSEKAITYLASRSISKETAEKYGAFSAVKYFRTKTWSGEAEGIGFPYVMEGKPEAAKYRMIDGKSFTQDGAARSFFGVQHVLDGSQPLVITEGEIDALSMAEAGVLNAVSVPSGAPAEPIRDNAQRDDRRFGYLARSADVVKLFKKVVLALDGDAPGQNLFDELTRRIGRHLCYKVEWPADCKDANDVLRTLGKDKLRQLVADAKPLPLAGIQSAMHYADRVRDLYTKGLKPGLSTDIPGIDPLFTICPGQMSVVTGLPGSGKSEFVDQIMINLAQKYDWRFAVWSVENPPHMHISKLAEKYLQLPFRDGPSQRMREHELDRALKFIDDHFIFMEQADGGSATIESVLERASAIVMRNGARGLVIDPFNYLDMGSPERQDLTISDMLTKVRMFSLAYETHVWFVAHPKKMFPTKDGKLPIPNGNDISGGAAWWAKTDLGYTIHREKGSTRVLVDCWKCRFKWIGQIGEAYVSYNPVTGTYFEDLFGG
jgi:twinkle protein